MELVKMHDSTEQRQEMILHGETVLRDELKVIFDAEVDSFLSKEIWLKQILRNYNRYPKSMHHLK
jgi:hypothetical protein